MSFKVSITGLKEIDDVIKGLPKQLTHKIIGDAHALAAKPLINSAKLRVPMKSGGLFDSIGVKRTNIQKTNAIGLIQVGPIRGGSKKGYHGHLIEYGHKIVTKKGKTVGFSRKFPFMRPAFNETNALVESRIAKALGSKLRNYMRKIIKKTVPPTESKS